ncbi:MAG: DUF938 domain-containing protein [Pseudomonadota bacterium]
MNDAATITAALAALESPAAERNSAAIAAVLARWLPASGRLLELACGALQHARRIAPDHPQLHWQPSDLRPELLTLAPRLRDALHTDWPENLAPPIRLDVLEVPWPLTDFDVLYTANLLHIAPPAVSEQLFAQAPKVLRPGGELLVYGPFREGGRFRSVGDARFDESLRARDPAWGIRDLEWLEALARAAGLELVEREAMPANNLFLRCRARA